MKNSYLRYAALVLLSHLAQSAALVLLIFIGAGSTASFTFGSAYGLVLGVLFTAALSLLFGWGLRPKRPLPSSVCWNGAMALYVLNLAAMLCKGLPTLIAENAMQLVALVWDLPMIPALVGIKAFFASGSALWYISLALLAAVEPLCFTLAVSRARRGEHR